MASSYYTEVREKSKGGKKYTPPGATPQPSNMPMKSPNWPGLPGKGGPDRAAGVKRSGRMGSFNVKNEGFSG